MKDCFKKEKILHPKTLEAPSLAGTKGQIAFHFKALIMLHFFKQDIVKRERRTYEKERIAEKINVLGIDRDIMVAIQSNLGDVGIKVDIDFVDYGRYSEFRMKGWHDALLCQPLGLFAYYNQVLDWYFSTKSLQFPSLKRPDGFQNLLDESLSTIDQEKEKIQKVVMKIFEEAMLIPVHDTGRAYAVQKYVHDTQHMTWGVWVNWRPDLAWLSK